MGRESHNHSGQQCLKWFYRHIRCYIILAGVYCFMNECTPSSFPPSDHKGPEIVDYRRRDAVNRLMHPHLLADCRPAQKDRGRIQLGGQ